MIRIIVMNLGCVNIVYKKFSDKAALKKNRIQFENNGYLKQKTKQKNLKKKSFRVKGFF